ncbi:MAG TPA: DNA double-strand break repair nuclease NurA [Dehalococcoidia bacterium]|nr:DNA double-strand break repair nuclease NurA [Dehalococcoidia bacterium]
MLASEDVARQLPAVVGHVRDRLDRMTAGINQAKAGVRSWAADPETSNKRIEETMAGTPRPFALTLEESPDGSFSPSPFEDCTVVAADGSSIPVDRFAPLPCYAVNVGSVALPYGTVGQPVLTAVAHVGPAESSEEPDVSAGGLDLLRDVKEMEAVASLAGERAVYGPSVALLDGTLFPWDLDSLLVAPSVRMALRERTADVLAFMRSLPGPVSLGSYISASRAADVVTSLSCLIDTDDAWPESDSMLFRSCLSEGQRSAVFQARSDRARRVESEFSPCDQVCFFYIRFGDDIARVEFPRWATDKARVERLHAGLVDQCTRCDGYPRALQEAHEQAVVSFSDRDLFARLLEKATVSRGIRWQPIGKGASKRRRAL